MQDGLTVREALTIGDLEESKVIAGEKGLDNIIRHVSVIEVPDAYKWFKGNELWLTSFYTYEENIKVQLTIIEAMAKHNCAGLVICYEDKYIQNFPQVLIDKANELNIPIILFREDVAYADIISPIMAEVLNRETKKLEYTLYIHKRFSNLIFERNNNDYSKQNSIKICKNVANELSNIIKSQTVIIDHKDEPIVYSSSNKKIYFKEKVNPICFLSAMQKKNLKEGNIIKIEKLPVGEIILYPITYENIYYGTVSIFNFSSLSKMEHIAIEQACIVFAIVLINKIAIEKNEQKKEQDFLNAVLKNDFKSEGILKTIARKFNWDISDIKMTIFVHLISSSNIDFNAFESLSQKVSKKIKNENSQNIVIIDNPNITILLNSNETYEQLKNRAILFAKNILNIIKSFNLKCVIGIGSYMNNLIELKDSYEKAIKAAQIAAKLVGYNSITFIDHIEMLYYINDFLDKKEIRSHIFNNIEKLKNFDSEEGTSLFETFKFLINDESIQDIANKLYIHRNTVYYRKNKIIDIFNVNPFIEPYKTNYKIIFTLYQLSN